MDKWVEENIDVKSLPTNAQNNATLEESGRWIDNKWECHLDWRRQWFQ